MLLAVLLAWLTYRYIEKPLRFGRRKALMVSSLLLMMSGVLIAGLLGYYSMITPRNNNPALAKVIAATNDWQYPGDLEPFDPEMKGSYIGKTEKSEITLFMGDSYMEQYAPRVAQVIQQQPSSSNSAVFVTNGGCVFAPGVFEDSPIHRRCGEIRNYALKLVNSDKVKNVVIGGAWGGYFHHLNQAIEDLSSPSYHYYFLDHGRKISLRGNQGVQLALSSMENLIKEISETKKVYLLLDNPAGAQYDPHMFFAGDSVPADPQQVAIRELLIAMAERLGVDVIDPFPALCRAGQCLRAKDGWPLYTDGYHLRAAFVREKATYIDRSLHE